MKTADSIEEQDERKAARGDDKVLKTNGKKRRRPGEWDKSAISPGADLIHPSAVKPWLFKPGQSGNPSGRPKNDLAAQIGRAIFEKNFDALEKAYTKALLKGNAYAFKELADRSYGKMTERIEHEVTVSKYLGA